MTSSKRLTRLLALLALSGALAFAALAAGRAQPAQAANCIYISWWQCTWGGNTGPNSWFFFDGANPARNWWYNSGTDEYANPVGKCVRAGKGNNEIYSQKCDYTRTVSQNYPQCNCGGLYVGTQNLASGWRVIGSGGWH